MKSPLSFLKRKKIIVVKATWDDEAGVWCASSHSIAGLAIEAETKDALVERLKVVIPELWELNHQPQMRENQKLFNVKLNMKGEKKFALSG